MLSTVTLLGLLVATAAAFAITEHLKLIKSPVSGARVTRAFSPVCRCAHATATIQIRLRHEDRVTIRILDAARRPVATVAAGELVPARRRVRFTWNGRTDAGTLAPDGAYRPEIHLAAARRTILLPPGDAIVVDTNAPKVLSARVAHPVLSPGDHRTVAIHYAFSERAHAVVYLGRRRLIRGRPSRARGVVKWAGTRDGLPLRAGTYVLSVAALDLAGNETPAAGRKQVTVVIRYIELARRTLRVRAGARFAVAVETASRRYTWRLGRRHGAAHGKVLRLRAPTRRGTYRLVVAEHGHTATALVEVRR